ncbi:MAG: YiiD C-terminal domain-containing protein [Maricaulaceae bacterium]|jgi:acyl-coenzyme A thioesterase PaaI-like protein
MNAAPSKRPTVPFHEHTQIEFFDVPPGHGRIRAPAIRELTNHLGTVHGGMLFAIGEIAAANGMVRMLGADIQKVRAITRRGSIEYLKPARGAITGDAQVSMTTAQIMAALETEPSINVPIAVSLTDEAGVEVATLAIEWFVGRPKG